MSESQLTEHSIFCTDTKPLFISKAMHFSVTMLQDEISITIVENIKWSFKRTVQKFTQTTV